jgi:hypothetical protein
VVRSGGPRPYSIAPRARRLAPADSAFGNRMPREPSRPFGYRMDGRTSGPSGNRMALLNPRQIQAELRCRPLAERDTVVRSVTERRAPIVSAVRTVAGGNARNLRCIVANVVEESDARAAWGQRITGQTRPAPPAPRSVSQMLHGAQDRASAAGLCGRVGDSGGRPPCDPRALLGVAHCASTSQRKTVRRAGLQGVLRCSCSLREQQGLDEVGFYSGGVALWGGSPSPRSADKIGGMTLADVLALLRQWRPEDRLRRRAARHTIGTARLCKAGGRARRSGPRWDWGAGGAAGRAGARADGRLARERMPLVTAASRSAP